MRIVVRKDVYKSICNLLGIEKAGLPVHTRHGNYVKVSDNPSKWEYKPIGNPKENETQRRIRLANKSKLIPITKTNQQLMNVDATNYRTEGEKYIDKLDQRLAKTDFYCKATGKKISNVTKLKTHLYIKRHSQSEQIERTKILPYIMTILTDTGVKGKFTEDSKGDYREIVGKAYIKEDDGSYTKVGIAIIMADINKGSSEIKGISLFTVRDKLIKSYSTDAFTGNQHNIRSDFKNRLNNDFQL